MRTAPIDPRSLVVLCGMASATPAALPLVGVGSALGQTFDVIYFTGDPSPDGNGSFSSVTLGGFLNDAGQIAFGSTLNGTTGGTADDVAVFFYENGVISVAVREGDAMPDANGTLRDPGALSFFPDGSMAFVGRTNGSSGGPSDDEFIGVWDGASLQIVAREGQGVPGGSGPTHSMPDPFTNSFAFGAGGVAWIDIVSGALAPIDARLYFGDESAVVELARESDPAPDANGVFSDPVADDPFGSNYFSRFIGNDAAQFVFFGTLSGTTGGDGVDSSGIFLAQPGQPLAQIARQGAASPDANGEFDSLEVTGLNNSGQVFFNSFLRATSGGASDDSALFRADATTTTLLIREGTPAPDGNGNFWFMSAFDQNDAGVCVYNAGLTATAGGFNDDRIMGLADGTTTSIIARDGDSAPDGNGVFREFGGFLRINEANQVAFQGILRDTDGSSTDDAACYLHDPVSGFTKILRKADPFLGSTVSQFQPFDFNESGQILLFVSLADGRRCLVLWSPTTPCACIGNLDDDCDTDVLDFTEFAATFGSVLGDANFNPHADYDADDAITVLDFGIWSGDFGCPN